MLEVVTELLETNLSTVSGLLDANRESLEGDLGRIDRHLEDLKREQGAIRKAILKRFFSGERI